MKDDIFKQNTTQTALKRAQMVWYWYCDGHSFWA